MQKFQSYISRETEQAMGQNGHVILNRPDTTGFLVMTCMSHLQCTMDPTVLDILLLICTSCMCSCCAAHFYPNSLKEPYCTKKSHACFFSSDVGLRPTLSSEYLHSNQHGASAVMEMRFWDDFGRNRAGETQNHWVKISCLSFLKLSSVVELLAFIWYCRFPAAKC